MWESVWYVCDVLVKPIVFGCALALGSKFVMDPMPQRKLKEKLDESKDIFSKFVDQNLIFEDYIEKWVVDCTPPYFKGPFPSTHLYSGIPVLDTMACTCWKMFMPSIGFTQLPDIELVEIIEKGRVHGAHNFTDNPYFTQLPTFCDPETRDFLQSRYFQSLYTTKQSTSQLIQYAKQHIPMNLEDLKFIHTNIMYNPTKPDALIFTWIEPYDSAHPHNMLRCFILDERILVVRRITESQYMVECFDLHNIKSTHQCFTPEIITQCKQLLVEYTRVTPTDDDRPLISFSHTMKLSNVWSYF